MRLIVTLPVCIVLIFLSSSVNAGTWHIKSDGSGDAPTIQAGIDSAAPGDTVLVAPGTYAGVGNKDLDFEGKNLVLGSESGPEVTVIDCEGSGRGVYLHSGESRAAMVEGITIRNGYVGGTPGGGMYCDSASPTVRYCHFSENSAYDYGGGLCCYYSSPLVASCTFSGNSADSKGGGLYSYESNPTVRNCTFSGNFSDKWGGGMYCDRGSSAVSNCTFSDNSATQHGGGMFNTWASVTISDCTFTENSAGLYGGGIYFYYGSSTVQNSIIAFSTSGEAIVSEWSCDITLTCCDIYGNAGGDWVGECFAGQAGINGNISADPIFCGELFDPDDPYGLHVDSPCTAANSPCGQIGARPSRCYGPVATEPATWGNMNALLQNVPNPFNSGTQIAFSLEKAGRVGLKIFDARGRLVRELVDEERAPKRYVESWDGKDSRGRSVAAGTYFYRLELPGWSAVKKMTLAK